MQTNATECGIAVVVAAYAVCLERDADKRGQLIGALCVAGGVQAERPVNSKLRMLLTAHTSTPLPLEAVLRTSSALVRYKNMQQRCFAAAAAQLIMAACDVVGLDALRGADGSSARRLYDHLRAHVPPPQKPALEHAVGIPTDCVPLPAGQQDAAECLQAWMAGGVALARELSLGISLADTRQCRQCQHCVSSVALEEHGLLHVDVVDRDGNIVDNVPDGILLTLRREAEVDCGSCGGKLTVVSSTQPVDVVVHGHVLVLQLKRFTARNKVGHRVRVPRKLRIGRLIWRLVGAVCHRGDSVMSGHYVAFAERAFRSGELVLKRWIEFDDLAQSALPLSSAAAAIERMQRGQQPYLLLFALHDTLPADAQLGSFVAEIE